MHYNFETKAAPGPSLGLWDVKGRGERLLVLGLGGKGGVTWRGWSGQHLQQMLWWEASKWRDGRPGREQKDSCPS